MSAAYYIVVNADPPPFDSAVNGQALARAAQRLSAAANTRLRPVASSGPASARERAQIPPSPSPSARRWSAARSQRRVMEVE